MKQRQSVTAHSSPTGQGHTISVSLTLSFPAFLSSSTLLGQGQWGETPCEGVVCNPIAALRVFVICNPTRCEDTVPPPALPGGSSAGAGLDLLLLQSRADGSGKENCEYWSFLEYIHSFFISSSLFSHPSACC